MLMIMKNRILLIAYILLSVSAARSQCYPDRHSTNFFDGWISCAVADNPNPLRGKSHFILFDYGKIYKLGQAKIWNSNDPAHLDYGMRDVYIDYSLDGENWTEAGVFTFPQASGLNTYEGEDGPFLNDIEARYLLITGINNYGGDCYGLSEIRISAEEVIISDVDDPVDLACVTANLYPNPFTDQVTLSLNPGCSGELRYILYDGLGKMVLNQTASLMQGQDKTIQIGGDLPAGTYNLYLEYGGKAIQRNIVKMNRS